MSLLDHLIWGDGPKDFDTFPEISSPPSPSSPLDPELAQRVAAFRQQAEEWASSGRVAVPLLILPSAPPPQPRRCFSCGELIPEGRWRCGLCRTALYLALRMMPPEDTP